MSCGELLDSGRLRREPSTAEEVSSLLAAGRALTDAGVRQVSPDGRFICAYQAALSLATVVVRAEGWRVQENIPAQHWTALAACGAILGRGAANRFAYYQSCRRKRAEALYRHAGVVSEVEAQALVADVTQFRQEVLGWLRQSHPDLAAGSGGGSGEEG